MTDAKVQNTLKQLNQLKMSGVNENIGNKPKNRYGNKKSSKSKTSDSSISVNNSSIEDQKTINSLESLDSLKDFMANYDKCKLHESATNMVFSDGNPKSEIMLIGEAPGHDEDIQGKPFVGRSGKLLDKMLEAINLNREKVYIANIVPWRPPNNRRPTDEEIDMCLPMIKKHIELINPKAILLLGSTATYALIRNTEGITKIRGKWVDIEINKKQYPTLPTFHPAFLLRQPGQKKYSWEDLKSLKKKVES